MSRITKDDRCLIKVLRTEKWGHFLDHSVYAYAVNSRDLTDATSCQLAYFELKLDRDRTNMGTCSDVDILSMLCWCCLCVCVFSS